MSADTKQIRLDGTIWSQAQPAGQCGKSFAICLNLDSGWRGGHSGRGQIKGCSTDREDVERFAGRQQRAFVTVSALGGADMVLSLPERQDLELADSCTKDIEIVLCIACRNDEENSCLR